MGKQSKAGLFWNGLRDGFFRRIADPILSAILLTLACALLATLGSAYRLRTLRNRLARNAGEMRSLASVQRTSVILDRAVKASEREVPKV